jgi:hypothetical protein
MKRILSVFLFVLLLMFISSSAWAAVGVSSNDPIIVTTAAQLDAARSVPSNFYRLGANIDLTSYLASGGVGYSKWGTAGWMPIGTSSTPFTGGFDGAGYKITGLYINRSSMDYVGLFGSATGATIKNLGVEIASAGIKGSGYVGGLVGYITNGSIIKCYTTGNITGFYDVGGITGRQFATNVSSSITNCYATGNISGTYYIGGLIGEQYATGVGSSISSNVVTNCYAKGNVVGTYYAGGLMGFQCSYSVNSSSIVTNSFAAGNVSASSSSGGLIATQQSSLGGKNTIAYCYAMGNVSSGYYAGALIGEQLTTTNNANTITNCYRYQLATVNGVVRAENTPLGIHGGIKSAVQLTTQSTYSSWSFNSTAWYWDTRGFPKLNMGMENYPFSFTATLGDSANNPIIITTAAQLDSVRDGLEKFYKLGSNVDLTSYLANGGAGYAKWGTSGWAPIGGNIGFRGGFDGAGYKITGLWVNRPNGQAGLFDYTWGATIKNLGVEIAAAGVKGNSYTGGLVGRLMNNSSIERCYVAGNISATGSYVGGLAGDQSGGSIDHCYTIGYVTTTGTSVGGLVGYQSDGIITNCYSTANVEGYNTAGGLVGYINAYNSDSITNCYATGNVTISVNHAGGLIGYIYTAIGGKSYITNCYSTSNITAPYGYAGGIAGTQNSYNNGSSSTITGCYATGAIKTNTSSYVGGLVGWQTAGSGSSNIIASSYRYQSATINGVVRTENTPNGIHGGIVTESQLKTQSTYTNNKWAFNSTAWNWDTRGFPKLNMGTENSPFIFAPGGDSPNNPIVITTAAQLDAVRDGLNKYYKLGGNIDLTSYLASGGAGYSKWGTAGWLPIGTNTPFRGGFDGAGYKITGLWINRSNVDIGLFGYAYDATIKNLGLEIAAAGIKGYNGTGGLAGSLHNCIVERCYVTGNISATYTYVGGITGRQYGGSIDHCYTSCNVTTTSSYAGGLVGYQSEGLITNCYTTGNINGYSLVGGLIGYISAYKSSIITSCYTTGSISASVNHAGGLVGYLYAEVGGKTNITNSYSTSNITAASGYAGGLVGTQYSYNSGSVSVITSCYSTGNVKANTSSYVGGIVGWQYAGNGGSNSIANCYRYQLATVNGVIRTENTPNGIHGGIVTASQLKTQSTYTSNRWTFSSATWNWDTRGFPKLNMGAENIPFRF